MNQHFSLTALLLLGYHSTAVTALSEERVEFIFGVIAVVLMVFCVCVVMTCVECGDPFTKEFWTEKKWWNPEEF
jgi:hypothetical protein